MVLTLCPFCHYFFDLDLRCFLPPPHPHFVPGRESRKLIEKQWSGTGAASSQVEVTPSLWESWSSKRLLEKKWTEPKVPGSSSGICLCALWGEGRKEPFFLLYNKLIKAVTIEGNNIYTIFCASCIMQNPLAYHMESSIIFHKKRPLGSSQMALYSNTTLTGLPARNPEKTALVKIQFHPRTVVPPHKIGPSVLRYECYD